MAAPATAHATGVPLGARRPNGGRDHRRAGGQVDHWDDCAQRGESVDLLADFTAINTEIMLRPLIGVDLSSSMRTELTTLIDAVFAGMSRRMWTLFVPTWLPVPGREHYRRAVMALDRHVLSIIAARGQRPVSRATC